MKYILANWKMYLDTTESIALAQALAQEKVSPDITGVIFPTLLSFREVYHILQSTAFSVGVQNINWAPKGAYTGAVSALLAAEAGAKYTLVGHSERRYIFGEKDADVAKKIAACEEAGLIPVICLGETKDDVAENKRQYRLKRQIEAWAKDKDFSKELILAYEPVWAISSSEGGQACLPADAEDVIGFIKQELQTYTTVSVPVLYGGSVNETNAPDFLALPSVDGVIIGAASTKGEALRKVMKF